MLRYDTYATQSNNPDDVVHAIWNKQKELQQQRLALLGGSWSQPPWNGWHPMVGAGTTSDYFFQRYAQDGDSGFFHGLQGRGEPLGIPPTPPNTVTPDFVMDQSVQQTVQPTYDRFEAPLTSNIDVRPITQPAPVLLDTDTQFVVNDAEPEQHALHVPPYSQMMKVGIGKGSALYEEAFEFPEPVYSGRFHKKQRGRR
jgi:hypothetical protein